MSKITDDFKNRFTKNAEDFNGVVLDVMQHLDKIDHVNNMCVSKPKGTQCQKCGEFGQDRRILRMSCLYDMNELKIPFILVEEEKRHGEYTLTVCKDCRGDWMQAIEKWFLKGGVEDNV